MKKKTSWNKGLTKETDERVRKISVSNTGKKASEKTRKILSIARKKWIRENSYSKETREKISKSRMGIEPWNKGLKKETDKRVAKNAKSISNSPKVLNKSEKVIESYKKRMNNFTPKTEKILANFLDKLGIKYKTQFHIYFEGIGNKFYDFYLSEYNTIIEVDGIYWHKEKDVKRNDAIKTLIANYFNYNLVRITDKEIYNKDFIKIIFNLVDNKD